MSPEIIVRIIYRSQHLDFTFDKEKKGDYVVRSDQGRKTLLIGSDSLPLLRGVIIGYQKIPGFIMGKVKPDA